MVYRDNPDKPGESMEITQQKLPAGTTLNDLPLAVRKSSTFVGWCYDWECTDYVGSEDRLLGDLTLYAAYTDMQLMESVTMDTYARAYDVATDFAIGITNTGDVLDNAEILAACKIKNVSDPSEEITMAVTRGEDNTCTVSNPNGWQPGASYKLTLKNDQLYFTGFDKTIREYDFTVYREETKNVELNREIRYIHTRELSNLTVNGKTADSVSVAVGELTFGDDEMSQALNLDESTTVDPGTEPEQDGEMIITWKNQEGTFNTQPLTIKIRLHWDNLRDGYYIAFDSQGGSYVDTIMGKYNSDIKKPEDPVRTGYRFAGWYEDEELTTPYTIPAKMPNKERMVYAKWEAEDVGYQVVEYLEGTNGVYEAQDPISYSGLTDTEVTPKPAEHEGYETPKEKTETVRADGTTVVKYYYPRAEYHLTFLMEENGETVASDDYRYGTFLTAPAVYRPGYEFQGWSPEVPESVPTGNMTYTATWKASDGIPYAVRYYVEEPEEGGYTLSEIKTMTGTTGETVTAPEGDYSSVVYHRKGELASGEVKADGSLVLKVYYDLNIYTLTYDPKGGTLDETTLTARPGERIGVPVPVREGYTFEGWYLDEEYQQSFGETMPDHDLTVYAKWEQQTVNYMVRHYQEKLWSITGNEEIPYKREFNAKNYELTEEESFAAHAGDSVTPEVKSYTGFSAPEKQTVEVLGDGSLVVNYYYTRNTGLLLLEVTGNPDGKEFARVQYVPYGTPIGEIKAVVERKNDRAGYTFEGWYTDGNHQNPFDGIMPAVDANTEEPDAWNDGFKIYGKWTPVPSEYRVEHYQQNPFDPSSYILVEEETKTALTDTEVTPEVKSYPGFQSSEAQTLWVTGYDVACMQYYYDRNSYSVTYVKNNGEADETADVMYGAVISEVPKYSGHAFAGWYEDAALTVSFEGKTMPMHALTLYAKWEPEKKTYQVIHQLQSADGSDTWETAETETFTGTAGDSVEPEVKAYDGFTAPEKQRCTLTVSDDPDTITYITTEER